MDRLRTRIDPNFLLVVVLLAIWWLISGGVKTPASEIAALQSGRDPAEWASALASPDRNVREYAREHIMEACPPESLGGLAIQAAQSDDPGRQAAGLWLLSQVDAPGRGAIAARFLDAQTTDLRRAALDVLAKDPSPEAHAALVRMVEDDNASIRVAAVVALSAIGSPADLEIFLDFLGNGDPVARQAAHKGILKIIQADPIATQRLLDITMGSDLTAAREAVGILGEVGGQPMLDRLLELLEYGPPGLSGDVAEAIGRIDGDEARTRALEIYRTGSTRARHGAARALESLRDTAAGPDLLTTALNPNEELWLRYYSLEALTTCGTPSLVPQVLLFLQDETNDQRLTKIALEALGGMGSDEVLETYDRVLAGDEDFGLNRDGSNGAKIAVVAGLGHMDTDASRERLRGLLERSNFQDADLNIQVVRSLGKVGTREDIPGLEDAKRGRMLLRTPVDEAIKAIEKRYPEPVNSE